MAAEKLPRMNVQRPNSSSRPQALKDDPNTEPQEPEPTIPETSTTFATSIRSTSSSLTVSDAPPSPSSASPPSTSDTISTRVSTSAQTSPTVIATSISGVLTTRLAKPLSTKTPSISKTPAWTPVPAQSDAPLRDFAEKPDRVGERPLITGSGIAAAVTLSVLGAITLIVGVVIFFRRQRGRQRRPVQRAASNDLGQGRVMPPTAPAIIVQDPTPRRTSVTEVSRFSKFTDRSSTIFGASSYQRPETVSTNRDGRKQAPSRETVNPFEDPPRHKAYDLLAGRPRSTTLTDRGSWLENPFRDPESQRFDPFGELKEKARQERKKQLAAARQEEEARRGVL